MRRALTTIPVLFATMVAGIACARHGPPAAYEPGEPVSIVIQNNNSQDLDVFAFGDGGRRRLGTIVSHSTQTYFLDSGFIGASRTLQLTAEPIANRSGGVQARIGVQPGQEVRWTLESSLARSFFSVR